MLNTGKRQRRYSDAPKQLRVRPQLSISGKKAGATTVPPAIETNEVSVLEIKLQSELELPRIVGCRRTAVVMAVARPLMKRVHIIDEW